MLSKIMLFHEISLILCENLSFIQIAVPPNLHEITFARNVTLQGRPDLKRDSVAALYYEKIIPDSLVVCGSSR